ncbi:fabZ [Mucuna pruriens]|uniref:3-hydroxyacyl-[acyl-carrier-protein] dehydratase n=1 Tax=Mucuna pruriens TaxID=157652 RepID=A0A371E026_MUCPR|nr:fabZ [Mucuna pruriens]
MAASTFSNTLLSNTLVSPISAPSKPKISLVKFPNTRSHPPLRKTTAFCSSDAANAPQHDTPIELRYPAFPTVLDINQIRDILPHRFPFLLVDRVIEYTPGVSAVAIKNVTINDNFFPGHFPERPIMPGVLMVEAMAQVGGLVMLQPEVGGSRDNFFFAGIDKVRFRKPVIAGDTLVMRMTLTKLQKRFGIAKMEGKAYVGGEVVCEVALEKFSAVLDHGVAHSTDCESGLKKSTHLLLSTHPMRSNWVPRRVPKEKGAIALGSAPASNHGTPLQACPTKMPRTAVIAHRP